MTDQQSYKSTPSTRSSVLEKARKYNIHPPKQEAPQPEVEQDMGGGGGVTPELLVDALSGHEDGLLAIAERLMEHYDKGYDVMGEAIIDAFADVQKLFQHVVEAAHMEGAAFEASRREQEDANKRRNQGDEDLYPLSPADSPSKEAMQASPGGQRHDEFIDDDVRQVLAHAIREGQALRDASKHMECYEKYEQACQGASALLPVDSDHRGRLQLSIARAESMTAERACAILRYAMDDVLRSGQRAHSMPMPDPSKRADVVLQRPKEHPSLGAPATPGVVLQSADEALASLMEEMKEVLSAPLYQDTPVQDVARRFWETLEEMQKTQEKDLQMLEQKLANLKGDFLLARAEWEEKFNKSLETADMFKKKYETLKDQSRGDRYMEQARGFSGRIANNESQDTSFATPSFSRGAESVASFSSGLAQHAKKLVAEMNCHTNPRTQPIDSPEDRFDERRVDPSKSTSKSFSDMSPKRVDV